MPTYEYRCANCSEVVEALQKISESPLTICPSCHQDTLVRGPGGGIGFSVVASSSPALSSKPKGCCPCGKNKGSCS